MKSSHVIQSVSEGLLLTATDAARFLGISRAQFYTLRGSIPVITMPGSGKRSMRRYSKEQLEFWAAQHTELGTTQAKNEVSK